MTLPEALAEVEKIDAEARALKAEIFQLCWYMRGSVSVDEAYMLSPEDRIIISELISKNMETTKKSGLAFI